MTSRPLLEAFCKKAGKKRLQNALWNCKNSVCLKFRCFSLPPYTEKKSKEDCNPAWFSEFAGLGSVLTLVPAQTIRPTSALELLHMWPEAGWFHTLAFNWQVSIRSLWYGWLSHWASQLYFTPFGLSAALEHRESLPEGKLYSQSHWGQRSVPGTWLGSLIFRSLCYDNLTAGNRMLLEKNPGLME